MQMKVSTNTKIKCDPRSNEELPQKCKETQYWINECERLRAVRRRNHKEKHFMHVRSIKSILRTLVTMMEASPPCCA